MQITDMKSIKLLHSHKTFLLNPIQNPNNTFSCHSRSRLFHSTALRFFSGDSSTSNDSQNAPKVWSNFNPLTQGINDNHKEQEQESVTDLSNVEIRVSSESVNSSDENNNKQVNRMGLMRYSKENEKFPSEKRYNVNVKRADLGNESVEIGPVNRKKGKIKTIYVCNDCGNEEGQWWGFCRSCGKVGTLKQFRDVETGNGNSKVTGAEISENVMSSWLPQKVSEMQPLKLKDVNQRMNQSNWRISLPGLFGSEVARVLGGGVVPGSLILIGGDPGVGKSTLLLQVAALMAEGKYVDKRDPVVYVSGEESVEQIVNRADRLSIGVEDLYLYSSTDIEDILAKIQPLSPCALIVDSIQTAYIQGVTGSAGGISQVKECTSALLRFAKKTNIPVLLIGHVNKSGDIAGPRVLEHIVDVVLYLEGEKHSTHRLLRPVKNRFGSTDELGVFEMSHSGLQTVSNPSEIFLSEQHSDSEILVGLAVAVIMDGSRSFLLEIQALCATSSSVSRHVNGIQASRADMIISVLKKQAGLMLQQNDIFLNVVSGVSLTETAGDLAIAAAICSSYLEFPIPNNVAFIGEIGLGGELRRVPRMEKRIHTVAKLGYKVCIVPKSATKSLPNLDYKDIQIIGCANLKQVIDAIFTRQN
ncbi:uncharacterized protein LOC126682646 [Mercurialis annua]|uniref:uncharacterized protein LOC126682646 n=1 Tax=Mercurialis annua TaxID=3986 RepID=UPI00215DDBD6|nr:uncharacterized protein LOC126682646 [Mercurialis annua]